MLTTSSRILRGGFYHVSLAGKPVRTSMRTVFVSLSLALVTGCQTASSLRPISASALAEEYERSNAAVRRKYDGKEIRVGGYAIAPPAMPRDAADQGSVLLRENAQDRVEPITCWFTKGQAAEFSKVEAGLYVTVQGVFNGETGGALRFCKLINTRRDSK
jgi:putative nucleic acid binding protein